MKKALMIEKTDRALYKLVEVTLPEDGRKKPTYEDLSNPSSIEVTKASFDHAIYRLWYPK